MSDTGPPKPFNPTWLTVAAIVVTGVISGSVNTALNSRDVVELRARQDATDARVSNIEKRFTDEQLATGKTLVALQKDVETANKTLTSIQNALMIRPATVAAAPSP